jgi:DNA modification methylase
VNDRWQDVLSGSARWAVVQGDCLDVMREMPDGCVDVVVTDIPYGTASATKVQKKGNNDLEAFNLDWDHAMPLCWLPEAFRVTVEGGSLMFFCENGEVTTARNAARDAGWHFLQTFYWIKKNPPPQPRKNFCSGVETAIFCRKPGKIAYWGGGGATLNWYASPLVANELRIHPTQKDTGLMRGLVRALCPPDGIVLDPFSGGGTVAVAAAIEGRRCIAVELNPEYAIASRCRIEPKGVLL